MSVSRKPLSILMVVITTEISTAMVIIAPFPVPAHIMIMGPRAILGRLFSTTTYGSNTSFKKPFHHKRRAAA